MDDPLIVSGKHTGTDLMTARVSFSVESVTRTSPVATDVVKAIKKIAPRIRNRIFVTTDFWMYVNCLKFICFRFFSIDFELFYHIVCKRIGKLKLT